MPDALSCLAFALAAASATALYAGSGHCRWAALRRDGRHANPAGLVLAMVALALWCAGFGIGPGLCLALSSWATVAIALAWLGAWTGRADGRPR